MHILKQSTAVVVQFGPFVDPTDGVTLKNGLVSALDNGSTGIKISKAGGALAVRHAAVTATTYDGYGDYLVTLDTTDTGTLGRFRMIYAGDPTCLPVWRDFSIVPANVHDALIAGSVFLKADIAAINTVSADAALLAGNVEGDVVGTVNTAVNGAGDSTHFSCSDITEATASHYLGKQVTVKSGTLAGQWLGVVTAYALTAGEGQFLVSPGSPTGEALVTSDKVVISS